MSGLSSHVRFVIACSACHQPGAFAASISGLTSMSRPGEHVTGMIGISRALWEFIQHGRSDGHVAAWRGCRQPGEHGAA
jgi:hypothetical protein